MQQLILIIHLLAAISIIALVLVQHGKGADVGAAFGSGSSNTMFGSTGATPFLVKLTAILAAVFFATSIGLTYLSGKDSKSENTLVPLTPISAPAAAQPIPLTGDSQAPVVPADKK